VTLANFDDVVGTLEQGTLEAMTVRLDRQDASRSLRVAAANVDALVVGPGLGTGEPARCLVETALALPCFKVVDADALTICAEHPGVLKALSGPALFTPHPGEAARLLGTSVAEVERDRFAALDRLVELTACAVLLKGAYTLVGAPGQTPHANTMNSRVLATGGSGDVLSGLIAALGIEQEPHCAGWLAAGIHGLCGQTWEQHTAADRGMVASEIADHVPGVLAQLARTQRPLTD
jgi:NAD(P)H-hydrate epimerase